MPSKDVVMSEGEFEAVKALLRSHKRTMDSLAKEPPYFVSLPMCCQALTFGLGGGRVMSADGMAVNEAVLTDLLLERFQHVDD